MSSRPQRIDRFERLAYGMFVHWGLYSQVGRGEWIQHHDDIPADEYEELATTFTASEFDADELAQLASEAGMNYIVLTTRHHDGFSLYDTRGLSEFDAPNSPAGRDLVREFVDGCRAHDIVPFFYHTTLDWRWGTTDLGPSEFTNYLQYLRDSVRILCTEYGDIGGFWFDGNWSRDDVDWELDQLYGLIRDEQPEAMIINNTGLNAKGEISHPEIDSVTFEQGDPEPIERDTHEKAVAGEVNQTMNRHWGYAAHDFDYFSPRDIILNLCRARGTGANYLLNLGPTGEGAIPEYEAAAFRRAGEWVDLHSQALYQSSPVPCTCEGEDFVLEADDSLFYFVFDLAIQGDEDVVESAGDGEIRTITGLTEDISSARWLDNDESLAVSVSEDGTKTAIDCTAFPYGTHTVVRVAELS